MDQKSQETKHFKISLKAKFVIFFLGIALIPLIIAVYISYDSSKRVLQEKSAHYLYSIADNRVNQIESLLLEKKRDAIVLARFPSFVEATAKLKKVFQKKGFESDLYQETEKELRSILTYLQESFDYDDFFILSPDNILLFSISDKQELGEKFLKQEEIDLKNLLNSSKALLEPKISKFYYQEEKQELNAFIVVPVVDQGVFINLVVFKINHQNIYNITQNYTGLGKTGEIVLALQKNSQALFIAPLRKDLNAAFNRSVDLDSEKGIAIQKALQGQKGWGITRDYENNKVLASWRYFPSLEWGLVVKMDSSEVLATAFELRNRLLIISGMLLIMITLITVLMVRSVTNPIQKLTEVAAKISQGNLLARARINSRDEIEDLGKSFNKMTDNLLKTQNQLKQKSKELAQNLGQIKQKNQELKKEKHRVLQERDKLDAILKSIGDGVFVINPKKKITIFNAEAEVISGFKEKEVLNKPYDKFLKFVFKKNNEQNNDNFIIQAIKKGKLRKPSFDTVLLKKNKKKIPIFGSAAPLKNKNDQVVSCVVVIRDVTKDREIDQAKTEFVSLASHQLRTPLSAVSWYAEMLLDEDVGKINQDQEKYLKSLYEANHRMVELVDSLLNVSRIELGTFAIDPEPINFITVANSLVKELSHQIEKKEIKLNKKYQADLPIVSADPKLLRIVLQNLLSNAIKYTLEKGEINLEIKKQEQNILIKVEDNGLGIPEKQQNKIFSKLFRADNVVGKDTDGTGLGLYIVKKVVEQSGGEVWFESKKNKGTSFFVTIPLSGMKKKKGTKVLSG